MRSAYQPTAPESENRETFVAIVLSPVVFGPQALPALGVLTAKNELTRLSKSLLEKLTAKKEADFLARAERMQMAYGFICFTAFFEALDRLLPDDLRRRINLQPDEKKSLSRRAARRVAKQTKESLTDLEAQRESALDILLPFPHPVSTHQDQTAQLSQLYNHMAKGFSEFLQKLAIGDERDEETVAQIRQAIQELPDTAIKCFEGQYFALAQQYQDFCVWSRLQEYKTTQHELKNLSDYVKSHAALLAESEKRIDIGFEKLQKIVLAIPDQFKAVEAANIVEGLRRHYEVRINEPIIEDKYEPEQGKPALKFPKIAKAFIPQSYRVLRYTTKDRHLEREETWKELEPKRDLGAFMLSYLSSPYSIETPLVVLGHPGSGKSLLTKILCARLMSESYTPVRVPLREVDADSPIESQIEEEIHHVTGNRISSWANFSGQFSQRPLVIFLDGYDELLQASGKVFAGYLKTVQQFQQREAEQGRPVRVIVTSRLALIDKATIPQGSTILRLLEFNEKQRTAWIKIWNNTNTEYFKSSVPPMEPFEIPEEKKILELAEQPLLLLMLALYDSDGNSLRQKTSLDRTILYESLLRRFVSRELGKSREFESMAHKEQQEEIDGEMKRLGIAAIGMYNRRKLHIQAAELDSDLGFFKLERSLKIQNGRPMTQADMLLGSFFFIHKSRAGIKEREDYAEHDTAFEFLHNTFGEFLTADFILRYAFQETEALHTLKQSESLRAELQRKIQNPDGLAKEWFACLMYAPLYSRPVVVEMLREWTNHMLQRKGRSREDFLACLDEILRSQIAMVLKRRNLPPVMRTDDAGRFSELSLLDHIAIYTLNLIIIRTVLDKNEFVFDERYFTSGGDDSNPEAKGARPWDKLTHLWRSCFTLENLNGLTAVLAARREDSKIILSARKTFQVSPSGDRLETVLNVASALADNITAGLAGLLASDVGENSRHELAEIEKRLEAESIHLNSEFIVRRLRQFLTSGEGGDDQVGRLIIEGSREMLAGRQRVALVGEFFDLVIKAVQLGRLTMGPEFFERFMHPRYLEEMMMMRRPEVAVEWLRLVRETGGGRWIERLGPEFFERIMHPRYLEEMMERRPEVAVEWLWLAREVGGRRWIERLGPEFFERIMHPRYLEEMMERRPEVAVEWLRLAREVGGERWIERMAPEFFERAIRLNLARMPLGYLRDVQWYAAVTHNDPLMKEIQEYVASESNDGQMT